MSDQVKDLKGRIHIFDAKFLRDLMTGGFSAAIAVSTLAPFERIKIIMQVQHTAGHTPFVNKYTGLFDALTRIPKEQGFASLWRGNFASVLRTFPYQALNFALKEKFKLTFHAKEEKNVYKRFFYNLLSGGIAGSTSMTLIYPLDYARTRMAADLGTNSENREFKNLRDCIKKTIKADGIKGIYNGLLFSIFGVFIYRAAYFGLFDSGSELLPRKFRHNFLVTFAIAEVAATASGFASYPFDTVRRVMMMQAGKPIKERKYLGAWRCLGAIYKEHGWRGLFGGAGVNVIRGTGGALMLVIFDEIQYRIWKDEGPINTSYSYLPGKSLSIADIKALSDEAPERPAGHKDPDLEEMAPIKHLINDLAEIKEKVEADIPISEDESPLPQFLHPLAVLLPTTPTGELTEEEKEEEEIDATSEAAAEFFGIPGIPDRHRTISEIHDQRQKKEEKEENKKDVPKDKPKDKPPPPPPSASPPGSSSHPPKERSHKESHHKEPESEIPENPEENPSILFFTPKDIQDKKHRFEYGVDLF